MSGTDIVSRAPTTAENNPVYDYCIIGKSTGDDAKTHKHEYSISISSPTFHHFPVLFLGLFEIHGEK